MSKFKAKYGWYKKHKKLKDNTKITSTRDVLCLKYDTVRMYDKLS